MRRFFSNKLAIILFTFPALFLTTLFLVYPISQTMIKSLYKWNGLTEGEFILFENYKTLFHDGILYTSLKNGVLFSIVLLILMVGLPLLTTLILMNPYIKERKFLRTSYFVPVVLSTTVACQLFQSIYNPETGLINNLFKAVGIPYAQVWMDSWPSASIAIAAVIAWHFFGYYLLLIYTAVKSVPEEYYEAAEIDGAKRYQAHIHITLPMITETLKYCVILAFTWGFNQFGEVYIMTGGGPGTMTYTLPLFIYREGFKQFNFGYGCSVSMVLLTILLGITVIVNRYHKQGII